MNTTRVLMGGVLFLFTVLTGLLLLFRGRPLSTAIFTGHKLVALAAVILLGFELYRLAKAGGIAAPALIAVALSGLLVLALFASGALLSAGTPVRPALLAVHRVAAILATPCAVVGFYLLRAPVAV